jgi:nucleoside phosphorylase
MSIIVSTSSNEQLLAYFTNIEIGVVTALKTELDALINLAEQHETIVGANRTYHKLWYDLNNKKFTVIAHTLDRMGISSMSITLMEILYVFPHLKFLALVGIAAGFNSTKQNFGDILIPTKVYNYESGKYTEQTIDTSPENNQVIFNSDYSSFDIDTDMLQKIQAVTGDPKIIETIQDSWHEKKPYKLQVHSGNFACGSAVIASRKKVEEIEKAVSRKYIGIDMEAYALAAVNQLKHNEYPKMFIIKSITDFADSSKNDSEHEFASFVAAKMFIEICSHVLVEIISKQSQERAQTEIHNILILSATYEWNGGQVDVTKQLKEFIDKEIYTIIVDPSTFGIKDPAWGIRKTLKIHCKIDGKETEFSKKDGERFKIE